MPGIIGNNNIETRVVSSFPGRSFGAIMPADLYVAAAGDVVNSLHWYGDWNDGTNLTIEIGVFTVVAGVPAVLVGTKQLLLVNSGTAQWWSATGLSIPLVAGTTYTVAWCSQASHAYNARRVGATPGVNQYVAVLGTLPAVWIAFGNFGIRFSVYGNVVAGEPEPSGETYIRTEVNDLLIGYGKRK